MASGPSDLARSPLAEEELDRLWLKGDSQALADAHRRYRKRLEAVAYRVVRSHADAEDVVQRVFLALPKASYRGTSSLWSYLYRAVFNGSVNVLRARKRREASRRRLLDGWAPSVQRQEGPEAQVLEGEILAALARALLHVKPQHRITLTLRIVHGLSNSEIAEKEGIPLATVGTWLRRGREELRRALMPMLDELGRRPR